MKRRKVGSSYDLGWVVGMNCALIRPDIEDFDYWALIPEDRADDREYVTAFETGFDRVRLDQFIKKKLGKDENWKPQTPEDFTAKEKLKDTYYAKKERFVARHLGTSWGNSFAESEMVDMGLKWGLKQAIAAHEESEEPMAQKIVTKPYLRQLFRKTFKEAYEARCKAHAQTRS